MTFNSETKAKSPFILYFLCLCISMIMYDYAYSDAYFKYKPPLLPVFIRIDSSGNLSIGGEKSITTFIGTFTIGADYSAYLHQGYTTVVIRNMLKNQEEAYKVRSGNDELTVIADGKTHIEIKDKWVLIQVRGATNISFKQGDKSPKTTSDKPPKVQQDKSSAHIEFTSVWPTKRGEIDYDYLQAGYDWYYTSPPHWKITHYNGYMDFHFKGKKNFFFYALGSTKEGISYCDVILYANGRTITNKHIDLGWKTYSISSKEFSEGANTVRIELVGDTHIWIQKVWISPNR